MPESRCSLSQRDILNVIVSYYDDFDKAYEGDDERQLTTTPTFNNQELLSVYGPKITEKGDL